MAENRSRRARELAGLSLGQAARLLGIARDALIAIEISGLIFQQIDLGELPHTRLADLYGVSVAWLRGEVPLCDYAALDRIPGGRDLPFADRDAIAELLAARRTE